MRPTRRRYLRRIGGPGLLIGFAGCIGGGTGGSDGDGDGEDSATPTQSSSESPPGTDGIASCGDSASDTRPAGTGGPGVTLVSVDDCPALPVQPAIEIAREAATPEQPPGLRTVLTSTADEPIRVGEGRAVHFEYVTDDAGELVLLPGGGDYPADPDCWRLTEGIATTEEYRTFEIEAGGSSSRRVDLYATPDGDACLPVGEYRFETTISIVSEAAEPESSAQWGFSILLE